MFGFDARRLRGRRQQAWSDGSSTLTEMAGRTEAQDSLGECIKRFRGDLDLSLSELARRAEISKGYLWQLENGKRVVRPSATTLYAIADVLGVTPADLLGRAADEASEPVPTSLRDMAIARDLPNTDVEMLASINFRGA